MYRRFECQSCAKGCLVSREGLSGEADYGERQRDYGISGGSEKQQQHIFHPVTNSSNTEGFRASFSNCLSFRRLVDAIYPRAINEGLINMQMQKLTFYAISHPEKLERIGEYLVLRLSRDLARLRFVQVKIAVEAMDQLLSACHSSPSLPQFSENHLKMVQKLLESNVPNMEQLATASFVKFSNIEESTPSYHRQYDFFICKFSQMCHATGERWREMRAAGLRGLRGVVWKSVTEGLHPNIWEKQHMDKIVPSILYNLQAEEEDADDGTKNESQMTKHRSMSKALFDTVGDIGEEQDRDDPRALSDQCLRELMGKATFGSLRAVLEPALKHLDLHDKWQPPATFAIQVFRAIIYSIQTQNSYYVIQELINHLDTMSSSDAKVRIGIASVLSSIVSIAGTSIGPLLLSIFNSLLKHLRTSVEFQQSESCPNSEDEMTYQETLINAMGDFANALPDYQKVEMMMFTVGNIPNLQVGGASTPIAPPPLPAPQTGNLIASPPRSSDAFLQHVLVKTLLKVATKYRTAYLATVFTDSFLHTLIRLALVDDKAVRLTTLQIFHTLLDRHENLSRISRLSKEADVSELHLTVEKCSRADQMFMRKHVQEITSMLYQSICLVEESQEEELETVIDAILCIMALLCIEVGYDEVLMELFRLSFALQACAIDRQLHMSPEKRTKIHNVVGSFFNLSSQLLALPSLCQHVQQVLKARGRSGHSGWILLEGIRLEDARHADSEDELEMELEKKEYSYLLNEEDELRDAVEKGVTNVEGSDDKHDEEKQQKTEQSESKESERNQGLLFDRNEVADCLKASGKDVTRLLAPLNFSPTQTSSGTLAASGRPALMGLTSVNLGNDHYDGDADSVDTFDLSDNECDSSMWSSRRNTVFSLSGGPASKNRRFSNGLPLNVGDLQAIVNHPVDPVEEEKREMELTAGVVEQLRTRSFYDRAEEIQAQNEEGDVLNVMRRLLDRHAETLKLSEIGRPGTKAKNIFEMEFPAQFLY